MKMALATILCILFLQVHIVVLYTDIHVASNFQSIVYDRLKIVYDVMNVQVCMCVWGWGWVLGWPWMDWFWCV